jgi:SAM-dependent methyltransferase
MSELSRSDLTAILRRYYREELLACAKILDGDNFSAYQPKMVAKYRRALAEVAQPDTSPLALVETKIQELFSWLRGARTATPLKDESYAILLTNARLALVPILGQEAGERFAIYLLFFREVTSRFLLPEPMRYCLQHGRSAFQVAFASASTNQPFDHYLSHPALMRVFSSSFADSFNSPDRESLKELSLSGQRILDVGGGAGGLAWALTQENISVQEYFLMDLPDTSAILSSVRSRFLADVPFPVQIVNGDFFKSDLGNAEFLRNYRGRFDSLILTWIVHDWDDEQNHRLLTNILPLLKPDGELIFIERIKDSATHPFAAVYEWMMQLIAEGVERDLAEYDRLAAIHNFKRNLLIQRPGGRDVLTYCAR